MTTAKNIIQQFKKKVVETVKPLENKSIISIEGTNVFRVVDTNELLDNKGKFKVQQEH